MRWRSGTLVLAVAVAILAASPAGVRADVTCYDFMVQAEAQAVVDAIPGDPYGLDGGWPETGDLYAGNGVGCDQRPLDAPEQQRPDDEPTWEPGAGLDDLPDGVEEATIVRVEGVDSIRVEGPEGSDEATVLLVGIETPEVEPLADYEGHEVPVQCFAEEAQARIREMLPAGRTVYLETDEHAQTGFKEWHRHLWIEGKRDGKYYLASDILVAEGFAVVATDRLGYGLPTALEDPPPDSKYRDQLRASQAHAIAEGAGLWAACR